jgi:hypothetical protein
MRVCILAFVVLIVAPASAWAQRIDDNSRSTVRRLMADWVQYRIVSGRLLVVSGGMASNINHTQVTPTERITLEIAGGTPTMKYETHSPSEDLFIHLIAGRQFSARRTGKTAGVATFEFDQPAQGDVTLAVGGESNRRAAHAPNIWRLAVEEEELCRQTLFPLLESLRPGWKLASMTAAIEDSLFRLAAGGHASDRQQWKTWVDELGSDKFNRRTAAQRRLFEVGPNITVFLGQLDPARLDTEQRERVRDLIAQFGHGSEDTIEQVTVWLASDPEVWLSLMRRADESRRRLAARQLSLCLDQPIDFDPAADAATRSEQISRIQTQLHADSTPNAQKRPGENAPSEKPPAE